MKTTFYKNVVCFKHLTRTQLLL